MDGVFHFSTGLPTKLSEAPKLKIENEKREGVGRPCPIAGPSPAREVSRSPRQSGDPQAVHFQFSVFNFQFRPATLPDPEDLAFGELQVDELDPEGLGHVFRA
ncbi:MAG: hypothetical protein R3338_06190, partial [Thermoanaerobaculia bacterium]|nr:hypothetical protein [Thermoanaerobaculia bacterium]